MSVGHTYCHCVFFQGGIDEVHKQMLRNVIQKLRALDNVSFQNQEGVNKYGTSKDVQAHCKVKDALKSAKRKRDCAILERKRDDDTYRDRMTEQGLTDDIRKRSCRQVQ